MRASVRAMLSGVIDYAGLFPPAGLPLDRALRNFVCYREQPESWLLGRFVCPVKRLEEVTSLLQVDTSRARFFVAALGQGSTHNDYVSDLKSIADFNERNGKHAEVDIFETRLTPELLGAVSTQAEWNPLPLQTFFELPLSGDWKAAVAALAPQRSILPSAGFKVRCGGVEAKAFPSAEQIADVVICCRDHGVPLKATAGLHHPLRHFDAALRTTMQGFLNLFGAAVLAWVAKLNKKQVVELMAEEDASHFVFDDAGFHWQNYQVGTAQIAAARRDFITSFGSCSFDEPRADLGTLGLLD